MKKNFVYLFVLIGLVTQTYSQINWEKYVNNPVFQRGTVGTWDDEYVMGPSIVYDGSYYHMWYEGYDGGNGARTGYAYSTNGIEWTRYPNPIVSLGDRGSWDALTVFQPCVLIDNDTTFKMWFCGHNGITTRQIGYATSHDSINWIKNDAINPILGPGPSGSWDDQWIDSPEVIHINGVYHMWYAGSNGVQTQIGHATSPDGLIWEKDTLNPVLKVGKAGSWDDVTVGGPTILFDGNNYHMWYSGGKQLAYDWKVGYAYSSNGLNWDKYSVDAPVLDLGAAGNWDDKHVGAGGVAIIFNENKDSLYMWFAGGRQTSSGNIGFAVAPKDLVPIPGTKKWVFQTGISFQYSPAIGVDGTIYVGSDDSSLYAINPDGSKKWEFQNTSRFYTSSAIGSDGTIYIGSGDSSLYAINPDGSKKWIFPTDGNISYSPAIGFDGTIYVGSGDNSLNAINPDGTKKWAFHIGGKFTVFSSPAIGLDGTIYIGSDDSSFYAINPDGTKKWAFHTGGWLHSSPAIGSDGTIYIGSGDSSLYAINPDGTKKWAFQTISSEIGSPAIGSDGTIYVGSSIRGADSYFYAINPNGSKKWEFQNSSSSSPAIGADGTIYIGSEDDNLYAINPDGSKKWAFLLDENISSSPAIGTDGTIYIGCLDGRSEDGNLYAIFSESGGLANSPWPKFGHDNQNTGNLSFSTSVEQQDEGKTYLNRFVLYQNYPNPFNPTTKIRYQVPAAGLVSLLVYNILGEVVATLVNEEKPVGTYELTWNAENLSSGVYFYRLQAENFIQTKKMILMK